MFGRVIVDFGFLLAAGLVGLYLEIFWRRDDLTIRDRVNGLQFWPFLIVGHIACGLAAIAALEGLGIKPILSTAALPVILQLVIYVLALDFLFYVAHRIQHRFFWRFHSLHHSIEKLSALNSYHHWSEPIFQWTLILVPAFIVGLKPSVPTFFVLMAVRMQPYLIHSSTRLHLGPLGRVIIDGRFHRIHHSLEPRHFDKNFGALTPLWDWLFGTAYWPEKGEWPAAGVAGRQEPRNLKQWFGWRLRPVATIEGKEPAGDRAGGGRKLESRNVIG